MPFLFHISAPAPLTSCVHHCPLDLPVSLFLGLLRCCRESIVESGKLKREQERFQWHSPMWGTGRCCCMSEGWTWPVRKPIFPVSEKRDIQGTFNKQHTFLVTTEFFCPSWLCHNCTYSTSQWCEEPPAIFHIRWRVVANHFLYLLIIMISTLQTDSHINYINL